MTDCIKVTKFDPALHFDHTAVNVLIFLFFMHDSKKHAL